jgi:ParB/RepB/Spo0J family partition protein
MTANPIDSVRKHVDSLSSHPDNPRSVIDENDPEIQNLRDSIIEKGILEPLLINQHDQILAGHRRRFASQLAYRKTGKEIYLYVPCILRIQKPGEDPLEIMLHENMQRQSLSLAEEAHAFHTLMVRQDLTAAALARRLSLPVTGINSRLAITRTEVEVQALFDANLLPLTSAVWLAKVDDHKEQLKLANMLARKQMTTEALETFVRARKPTNGKNGATKPLQRRLTKNAPRRKKQEHTEGSEPEPTRAIAIAALERANGNGIKLHDVKVLLNSVCMACGMIENPNVCMTCPLPRLILGMVGRSTKQGL